MKLIKSLIAIFAATSFLVSCDKEETVIEYLDVTPNNIAGEWELVQWNGASLSEGTYFYIDIVRKDAKFTIYQNFDSMGQMPHTLTGNFAITTDVDSVISGMYDYDGGMWAYTYKITELTESTMTWTAVEDPTYVQEFARTTIPSQVKK